ncbi:hypothetical protein ACHMW5_02400 [Azospirillum melinis]|uniref:hypothetical protein n=1 Tax=Azospirillum melinis TaxID=328839 RepID=UPI00375808D4
MPDIPLGSLFITQHNGTSGLFIRAQLIPEKGEVEEWAVALHTASKNPELVPLHIFDMPGIVLDENTFMEIDDSSLLFDRNRHAVGNILVEENDSYLIASTWTNHSVYVNLKTGQVKLRYSTKESVGFSDWSVIKMEGDTSVTLIKHTSANHNLPS